MDVWCAIPTPETEYSEQTVYLPTRVDAESLAPGYMGCEGGDALSGVMTTMTLLVQVRHMGPRRNVWGVMRPGDARRKRVADFGAGSFRELLLRLAAEGYAE